MNAKDIRILASLYHSKTRLSAIQLRRMTGLWASMYLRLASLEGKGFIAAKYDVTGRYPRLGLYALTTIGIGRIESEWGINPLVPGTGGDQS